MHGAGHSVATSLRAEYVAQMVTVWVRKDPAHRGRFHRTQDCRQLRKPPSRGEHWELVGVDLSEVEVRPCATCYPDAPRIKIIKRYCELCRSQRPCRHNGGVAVRSREGSTRWVWPDANQMPYYRRQNKAKSA